MFGCGVHGATSYCRPEDFATTVAS
jgi:hypothetical protein